MMPLISAICLTRYPERSEMLTEALHSFQLQTYPNREIVIVNDGSPLAPAAGGVTVVNLPKRTSIGEKRNIGTTAAHGELIAPWDDDDFSMPERLELQTAQLYRNNVDSVRSSLMWLATSDLRVHGLLKGQCYATALMRRSVIERVGGYPDISYREDMELHLRMMFRGVKDLLEPDFFYVCRRHTKNVSNPFEGDAHFKKMLPSPDVQRINDRLAALRALPSGILVKPIHAAFQSGIPERVSASTPSGRTG